MTVLQGFLHQFGGFLFVQVEQLAQSLLQAGLLLRVQLVVGAHNFRQQGGTGEVQSMAVRPGRRLRKELQQTGDHSKACRRCSSRRWSAAKRRMPSASFSVAMASSFISQRKRCSFTLKRSMVLLLCGCSRRGSSPAVLSSSASNSG